LKVEVNRDKRMYKKEVDKIDMQLVDNMTNLGPKYKNLSKHYRKVMLKKQIPKFSAAQFKCSDCLMGLKCTKHRGGWKF
jgi:hypothetical protein